MGANDIIGDGREAWWWVPTIANINAPTVAEINAGIRISQWMTEDGAQGFSPETAAAPTSGIEDKVDTAVPGRITFSGQKLRFRSQQGTDTARNTLTYDQRGNLVRRKSISAKTSAAAGQKVRVFPVACGEPVDLDFEKNMPERWEVPVFPTSEYSSSAAIAA
ncbi:MAG: hypothetical protein ABW156_05765 [Jiangellaceae bacterium]